MSRIILASASPRRRQLLEWAAIPFDVIVADTDETYPDGISMEETAIHIARNKALVVHEKVGARDIVVAADTIVVLDDLVIGKPKDREDAIAILERLSARQHEVITGVCVLNDQREICFADTTRVWFHPLQRSQIEFYVDQYQPYDKAGAYAIQEWIGVVGIKSVHGDFYNVMGLPVSRVIRSLEEITREK